MDDPSTSLDLPPGRVVSSEHEGRAAYWLSDGPAEHTLWARLLADHERSGYWPLLLGPADDEGRPWTAGDAWFDGLTEPTDHDAASLLRTWWERATNPAGTVAVGFDEPLDADLGDLAPYGRSWPGGATPTPPYRVDPEERASAVAYAFLADSPTARLGLVAASCGADALTAAGWQGPVNHVADTAQISAVVRDWERRYGARVVALDGLATLVLSVAAPPVDHAQALRVAAEHFAFCPDTIWQSGPDTTLSGYAEKLLEAEFWIFWWD